MGHVQKSFAMSIVMSNLWRKCRKLLLEYYPPLTQPLWSCAKGLNSGLVSIGVHADLIIYNICSCKICISLLDIRNYIHTMFLLIAIVRLLRLLYAICILGNGHFGPILVVWSLFWSLLWSILNHFENNLCDDPFSFSFLSLLFFFFFLTNHLHKH